MTAVALTDHIQGRPEEESCFLNQRNKQATSFFQVVFDFHSNEDSKVLFISEKGKKSLNNIFSLAAMKGHHDLFGLGNVKLGVSFDYWYGGSHEFLQIGE